MEEATQQLMSREEVNECLALIRGRTMRGYTLASNILTNKSVPVVQIESFSDTTKRLASK